MSANPYQSPTVESVSPVPQVPGRGESLSALHTACVVLLVAGLFNYYAFDSQQIAGAGFDARLKTLVRTMNLAGIAVVFLLSWFVTLPLLERVGRAIRFLTCSHGSLDRWNEALYLSLKPAAPLAVVGAVLWLLWVVAFYYAHLDFVVISLVVGLPAHILALCVYGPLAARWFKLARGDGREPGHKQNR